MKILFSSILLTILCFTGLNAQYKLDTLASWQVHPGVVFTKYREPLVPNNIYVMEIDLKNPNLKIESVKAKNRKVGLEGPSVMARQQDSSGHRVIGIINADFFTNKEPTNIQVIKGEILRRQRDGYTIAAFDEDKNFVFANPYFDASLITKTKKIKIDGVDEPRDSNAVTMYNSYYGDTTGTQGAGKEIVLKPVNGWYVNNITRCVVQKVTDSVGITHIQKGELIISANDKNNLNLKSGINTGDTVNIYVEICKGLSKIKEVVGGRPIFLKDGELDSSYATMSFMKVRHPRTIIGFSKDNSKCYLIVVDGRRYYSIGMDVWEMTRLVKQLNIYNAMNLDGGGSSVMAMGNYIFNAPSDGKERPVANALMVISTENY